MCSETVEKNPRRMSQSYTHGCVIERGAMKFLAFWIGDDAAEMFSKWEEPLMHAHIEVVGEGEAVVRFHRGEGHDD